MGFGPLFGTSQPASKAFQNFTNRVIEKENFENWIHAPTGQAFPVLAYHGVGGAGKSWLLQKFEETLQEKQIPVARISFDPASGTNYYSNDHSRALSALRQQLGNVFCPRFDLAYAWLRVKENGGDEPALKQTGFAAIAWDLMHECANASLNSVTGGNLITWFTQAMTKPVWDRLKDTPLLNWLTAQTGQHDFLNLRRLNQGDIYPQLSLRLREDLAEFLPKKPDHHCRAVLMLDGYEWRGGNQLASGMEAYQDQWVRDLYHPESRVLIVIAGRDRVAWEKFNPDFELPEHLEQHLIGGLSKNDAHAFLGKCGIEDIPLREAILRVSADAETSDPTSEASYHALSLGLCADTVTNLRHQSEEIEPATFHFTPGDFQTLASRFLDSFKNEAWKIWLRCLAITTDFDEMAARNAWSEHRDVQQDAAWGRLDDFSFIIHSQTQGWLTMHPQFKLALTATHPDRTRDDELWLQHWKKRQTSDVDEFAGRAWFHHWQFAPSEALEEWKQLESRERQAGRMSTQYALIDWWKPTGIIKNNSPDGAYGIIHAKAMLNIGKALQASTLVNRSSNLRRAINCYQVAIRVFTEVDFPQDWATLQNNLGNAYLNLPNGNITENLQSALEFFRATLRVYTRADYPREWARTQSNLGFVSWSLPTGNHLKNLKQSIEFFQAALLVYSENNYPQDWVEAQNKLGFMYWSLPTGNRADNLKRAIECYQTSLLLHTEVDFPECWATAQNNIGGIYWSLSTCETSDHFQNAIESYQSALRVYTEIDFPEYWAMTQRNLGGVFWSMTTGNQYQNLQCAMNCYHAALRVHNEVDFPRDWARAQNNLAITYMELSKLLKSVEHLYAAMNSASSAIRGFESLKDHSLLAMATELRDEIQREIDKNQDPYLD